MLEETQAFILKQIQEFEERKLIFKNQMDFDEKINNLYDEYYAIENAIDTLSEYE